jgi:hypothetical protein
MLNSSSLWLYSSNLGTFWYKIEQFWPFEEISIFSNGGHFWHRTALMDTILKEDHPRIISAKFGWDWLSSFRGEDIFLISSPLFSNLHNRSKSAKVQSSYKIPWYMLKSSSLCLYSWNLGTFWLNIEHFWPFEEISIFSNGGHLGYRTALTDTILKGDHLRIISAKFGWDWLSSFRGEDFFLISSPFF